MSRWVLGITIFVICFMAPAASFSRGPYGSIKIGNWSGGAYTNDNDGKFSGCVAGTNYQSGISFTVMIGADGSWRLSLAHQNWALVPGQEFPIVLTFDGKSAPSNVAGRPISKISAIVEMPANSALIAQFRKAKAMSAFAQGQLFQFNLDGTAQLMPALANCVAKVRESGLSSAGDFTVASPPKPKPPVAATAVAANPPAATPVAATSTGQAISAPIQSSLAHRVALVIGNSDYRFTPKLLNPANDATDIAEVLRKLGFEIVEGKNLDRRALDDVIREFSRKLDRADLALFFYAGHGLQVDGKNYLIPIDAKLERVGDLALDAVDVGTVLAQMEADKRVNLIFLDACRDNPLARSLARSLHARSTVVGQGLATIQSAVGTMIAYSTQPDNVAFDGDGRNSPFAKALIKHLADPGIDISVVMRRVRSDVIADTREKQVPWDHSSLVGDVVIAR